MTGKLFPADVPERTWVQFEAMGFDAPVAGVVHRGTNPPVCGMPLGGIDTGCLDLEVSGLLGYSSIFNCHVPRRGPINQPLLGITVGERTWLLTTVDLRARRGEQVLAPAYHVDRRSPLHNLRADIHCADQIDYWGHYPVADMEFHTAAPVEVALRAWSPFIPGDIAASNTPGAVFEVYLRNRSDAAQDGTVAFSFPGPNEVEAQTTRFCRTEIDTPVRGLHVASDNASYCLGVIGDQTVRCGGEIGADPGAWGHIRYALPWASEQAGCSVAVDYALEPGAERTLRFVLAWYAPQWKSGGTPALEGNWFTHMYAARYDSATQVAEFLALNHTTLLERILAWQSVLLSDSELPLWLRSTLVDYLHLLTEDSLWAQAQPPIGDWCRKEDGLFGLIESPRWAPQIECNPCSFYGNLPLVYFFPELALSTLRGYKGYQFDDGQVPWIFGGKSDGNLFIEMAMPSRGYAEKPMTTLDGPCYVDMVDRMWMRTGNDATLREFYESVKRNTIHTMNLRPGSGPAGIVSMPADNDGSDWMETTDLYGIVPHVGGVHLAQLRMAQRMAQAMGDESFAQQCAQWLAQGSAVMEEHAWAGDCYMLYHELETGKKSNWVMGCQLDGEWMVRSHGLPGVFQPDRVATVLTTLQTTAIAEARGDGSVVFVPPPADRNAQGEQFETGYWLKRGVHPPGTFILAMNYIYNGQRQAGIELARQVFTAIMEQGWTWDVPVVFEGGTRARQGGFDYYQNLVCWFLPAALDGGDLAGPCKPGGLVDRIIRAGAAN